MFTEEMSSSSFSVTLLLTGYFRKFSRNSELSQTHALAVPEQT